MSYVQLEQALDLSVWAQIWPQLEQLLSSPTAKNLSRPERLVNDSRQVKAGDAFFALAGFTHQASAFIEEAWAKGASLVVTQGELSLQAMPAGGYLLQLPHLKTHLGQLLALSRQATSQASSQQHKINQPHKTNQPHTQAITGTNGKSSVAHYLCQAWELLGTRCALVGTLGTGALQELKASSHTTPDVFAVHNLFAGFVQEGWPKVALEASSHALDQGRLDGIALETLIFTNLSHDHLDYHGTQAAYAKAKQQLFLRPEAQNLVLNLDDVYGRLWLEEAAVRQVECQAKNLTAPKILAYSLQPINAASLPTTAEIELLSVHSHSFSLEGMNAEISYQNQLYKLHLPLLGEFNLANALAVIGALLLQGVSMAQILPVMAQLQPVPGRMQKLSLPPQQPQIVVDFAHTPDALEQVLAALRVHCQGKLWCVFGCGGNRDASKRQLMGAAAAKGADRVLVTDDNPRYEDPALIRQAVMQAAGEQAQEVPSRQAAISAAIQQAAANDWVLIAGKGHENWQEVAGQKISFCDLQEAQKAVALREAAV